MASTHPEQAERKHFLESTADSPDAFSLLSFDDSVTDKVNESLHTLGTQSLLRGVIPQGVRWNIHYSRQQLWGTISGACAFPKRSLFRTLKYLAIHFLAFVVLLIILTYIYFPSYTILPRHYEVLKQQVETTTRPGRGNPAHQKVFIATSLFDPGGKLAGGPWADNVLRLIDLLGPDNTFLSIYENDAGQEAQAALSRLEQRVLCNHSLVFQEHLGLEGLPSVTVPDGTTRVKRITYLAEVRNKALQPLDSAEEVFDKILYLNDVFFNPIDALQLLFSTNLNEKGHADYRAACAVDFINPFKFYDTFATRDLDGWGVGVPFFPWFAYSGDRRHRTYSDVVKGRDTVRVKACWGGMVAFDARFFQRRPPEDLIPLTAGKESPSNLTAPYRFRAEQDLFWDASECCLIHADIQSPDPDNTGIYMNPFVRCAYDQRTLSWLGFTRRFERLYTPIHVMVDLLVSFPRHNPRRAEKPWQHVEEKIWVASDTMLSGGSFGVVRRIASHSGFCGRRKLPVMKEVLGFQERNYEFVPIPST